MSSITRPLDIDIMNANQAEILKLLQEDCIDVRTVNQIGDTVLHLILRNEGFTQNELINIVTIFLTKGVDINTKNDKQETVLHLAVTRQLEKVIDFLILHGADKNVTDIQGNTIAHFYIENLLETFVTTWRRNNGKHAIFREEQSIAEKESASFVQWMLLKQFNFELNNKNDHSALYLAIEYNLQHILPILLKHTPNVDFLSIHQRNFLQLFLNATDAAKTYLSIPIVENNPRLRRRLNHHFEFYPKYRVHPDAFSRRYDVEIVKILLKRGVSVDHADERGLTALDSVICNKEKIEIVEILLKQFTEINVNYGLDLLRKLIKNMSSKSSDFEYYSKVFEAVVAIGVNLNSEDENGLTLVHCAVEKRSLKVIKLLKDNGANLNVLTRDGQNLLHFLAEKTSQLQSMGIPYPNDASLFDLLIKEGCDVNQQDDLDQSPLHLAIKSKNIDVIKLLFQSSELDVNCRQQHEEKTALHLAAERGFIQVVEFLLVKNVDLNSKDVNNSTPLHLAVNKGHSNVIYLLLKQGAKIDSKDIQGNSPLHLAVNKGYWNIVKLLIDNNADVNIKDQSGNAPLHLVTNTGCCNIAFLLLNAGADMNSENKSGNKPLHLAVTQIRNIEMVKYFLDLGVDINIKGAGGDRPIHFAASFTVNVSNKSMLQILFQRGALLEARNDDGKSALVKAIEHENGSAIEELLENGANVNDKSVIECITNYGNMEDLRKHNIVRFVVQHWIKLKTARICCSNKYGNLPPNVGISNHIEFQKECLIEAEKLKSLFINSSTSLLDWLRMNTKRRYLLHEKVPNLNNLPEFRNNFPQYSAVILGRKNEALARIPLLELAEKAWMKMIKITLPVICFNCILSQFNNGDLIDFIEVAGLIN